MAGRKSLAKNWITPDGLLCIEGWAREGLVEAQIAKNIGINPATLYVWKSKYPEIVDALKRGKRPVDIEVENKLLKRAMGYEYEEVTTEIIEQPDGTKRKHIKKTLKQVLPDTTAQIFWLKNRRPDLWRDKPVAPPKNDKLDDGFLKALEGKASEVWSDYEDDSE